MAKYSVKRNPAKISTQPQAKTFWDKFNRRSTSEKVMYVLSILIVLAMVLSLFVAFAPQTIQ